MISAVLSDLICLAWTKIHRSEPNIKSSVDICSRVFSLSKITKMTNFHFTKKDLMQINRSTRNLEYLVPLSPFTFCFVSFDRIVLAVFG